LEGTNHINPCDSCQETERCEEEEQKQYWVRCNKPRCNKWRQVERINPEWEEDESEEESGRGEGGGENHRESEENEEEQGNESGVSKATGKKRKSDGKKRGGPGSRGRGRGRGSRAKKTKKGFFCSRLRDTDCKAKCDSCGKSGKCKEPELEDE